MPASNPFSASLDSALDSGLAYLTHATPSSNYAYRASFRLDLDSLSLDESRRVDVFSGYSNGVGAEFMVSVTRPSGAIGLSLILSVGQDDGSLIETAAGNEIPLLAGWNEIDVRWLSGDGSGSLLVSVNDTTFEGLMNVDNGLQRLDEVRWGFVGGNPGPNSGVIHFDSFSSSW